MSRRATSALLTVFCLALLQACVSFSSVDGVDNVWREVPLDSFQPGVTTQAEVLDQLGPPSQLINLDSGVVFYYLAEKGSGSGKILIVWNSRQEATTYDRAIFFFDDNGVLEDAAYSQEAIKR
ncbi:MAG: hypothetical protein PVI87_07440 [Gammaproteobacteria bacterium]|jgi:outer membrane protein assembly factor BamE (lipoprotein component of BamABCDE complex)